MPAEAPTDPAAAAASVAPAGQTPISAPPGAAPNTNEPPDNPFAELDALDKEDNIGPKGRGGRTSPKSESVRGADGKFQNRQGQGSSNTKEGDPGTKPVSGEKTEVQPPLRTAELRARYDETKAKLADLEPKLAQYERELNELRTKSPDTKQFETRVSELQKENEALKEEIRFVNYQKHPEFIEKFQKPYLESWNKAIAEISQLNIVTEDGQTRKATANDFLALANAPLDQLDALAEEWFPKSAARVIRHVERIRDLAEAQDQALAEARKGAGEREKVQTEQQKQQSEAIAKAYTQSSVELTQKYPKWFAPDETDPAGNELLKKGFEYADSVFTNNGSLNPEQKAKRLAVVRAKAANHDRLASRLKAATKRIKDLEADLEAYEKSEPAAGAAGQPGGRSGDRDFIADANAELEALDRKQ